MSRNQDSLRKVLTYFMQLRTIADTSLGCRISCGLRSDERSLRERQIIVCPSFQRRYFGAFCSISLFVSCNMFYQRNLSQIQRCQRTASMLLLRALFSALGGCKSSEWLFIQNLFSVIHKSILVLIMQKFSIDTSVFTAELFASGSRDGSVALWDLRTSTSNSTNESSFRLSNWCADIVYLSSYAYMFQFGCFFRLLEAADIIIPCLLQYII